MRTHLLIMIISGFFIMGCNYRIFDLAEYPELHGNIPNGSFENKITEASYQSIFQTVIQKKCLNCHKAGGKAEEIPLTTYQELMTGTNEEGEALIVPGRPEESIFYKSLLPSAGRMMPPKKSLLGAVELERTETIKAWIASGALERSNESIDP